MTEPKKDKVHVITEMTLLEITIGPGPNAWGYTAEVVGMGPRKRVIRGVTPQLVIYDEVQEVSDDQPDGDDPRGGDQPRTGG